MPESHSLEPTVVFSTPARPAPEKHLGRPDELAHVRLTEGSKPSLSSETAQLLRSRLRATALVLTIGLAIFLVRVLTLPEPNLIWLRIIVLILAGGCFLQLRGKRVNTLRQLHAIELVLVGSLGLQTIAIQVTAMHTAGVRQDKVEAASSMIFAFMTWIVAILAYGIFVPNTWKRAACIVIPMATIPLLVTVILWWVDDQVAATINLQWMTASFLMTAMAAIAAVFGTYTVTTLRTAAFQAKSFGQYRLRKQLGSGGMGEVYLADHRLLKRPSAIKLIRPGFDTDAKALARFELEVQATAKLSHWNTVEIFDYGRTDDGTFYYVMEYLPGMSLHELVRRHGPMSAARVVHFLRQTCGALREAHGMGLIHRDIKPANIFAAQRGGLYDVAKLLDFGLVQPIVGNAMADSELPIVEKIVAGSPFFMSPEQAATDDILDARSDIYSLGATAYFLLTGQPPFVGSSHRQVRRALTEENVIPPSELQSDVPKDLEVVLLRCLEKEPAKRFADVRQLEDALAACCCSNQWTEQLAAEWWQRVGIVEEPAKP